MANLSIAFSMVDHVSDKLERMNKKAINLESSISVLADRISTLGGHSKKIDGLEYSGRRLADQFKNIETKAQNAFIAMDKMSKVQFSEQNDWGNDEQNNRRSGQMLIVQMKLAEAIQKVTNALKSSNTEFDKVVLKTDTLKKAVGTIGKVGSVILKGLSGNIDMDMIMDIDKLGEIAKEAIAELAAMAYEAADAFSNASSVVAKSTGAKGNTLKSLNKTMMDVYADADESNLSNIGAVVGEINTRFGLTDDELKEVADLFVLYADNTGANMVLSVKSIDSIMGNWNIGVSQTGEILDKLTFTSQKSGASVDALSNDLINNENVFKQLGYSMDDSLAMLAMIESQGMDSATVFTGLWEAVGNLNEEGENVPVAFQDAVNVIREMGDYAEATAKAIELFGPAGEKMVTYIKKGNFAIGDLSQEIGDSKGTLLSTAKAADTMSDHWTRAFNSINTAFSVILTPVILKISEVFAKIVQSIGKYITEIQRMFVPLFSAVGLLYKPIINALKTVFTFLEEHAGTGLEILGKAVNITYAIIKVMISEFVYLYDVIGQGIELFIEEISGLLAPVLSLINGILGFIEDSIPESIKAPNLVFEESEKNLKEYQEHVAQLLEGHDQIVDKFQSNKVIYTKELNNNNVLIEKMQSYSELDVAPDEKREGIEQLLNKLKKNNPDLLLELGDIPGSINNTATALKGFNYEQYKTKELDNLNNMKNDLSIYADELKEEQSKIQRQLDKESAKLEKIQQKDFFGKERKEYTEQKEKINVYKAEKKEISQEMTLNKNETIGIDKQIENTGQYVSKIQKVRGGIDALTESYNRSYEAARNGIDGAIALFDTIEIKGAETTIEAISRAFDSQKAYTDNYTANLEAAKEYGLDQKLIDSLSNGSDQSAEYLQAIISELESDGAKKDELIERINTSYMGADGSKDDFGTTVAEMDNNYIDEMGKLSEDLNKIVTKMSLEQEAGQAATSTMSRYTTMLLAGLGPAMLAAQRIRSAIANVFNLDTEITVNGGGTKGSTTQVKNSGTLNSKKILTVPSEGMFALANPHPLKANRTIPLNANGTMNALSAYIAGEEGPELIIGRPGSTVFPTSETQRILSAMDTPLRVEAPESMNASAQNHMIQEKKITLEIAGSGEINVNGSASKESILDIMINNIKPVLMNVLQQEIFEEGEACYEF